MNPDAYEKIASIVSDAGGRLVGRTKLQKIAFIMEAAGLIEGFDFEYYHYGPYSEDLASATRGAALLGILSEREYPASWGGFYSTYEVDTSSRKPSAGVRMEIIQIAAKADPVELELAATALYLANEGYDRPWDETARRKPEKAEGDRLGRAKELYKALSSLETPARLPKI